MLLMLLMMVNDIMLFIINNSFVINLIHDNMATLNQLISEIAHAVGQPNNVPLRRNIRQAIIHTRNELIRKSYGTNRVIDKGLEQRFRIELIDVPDGDVYGSGELLIPAIKRSKNKIPRPVRLTNGMPFLSVRTVGYNNKSISFAKEATAKFYHLLAGFCKTPVYDYVNGYIYIYGDNDITRNTENIIIESVFEYPHLIQTETIENEGDYIKDDEELDDNEFLLPEDMIGSIKDIIFERNMLQVPRETNETPVDNLIK